jgi:hypothetical protein
MVDVGIIVDSDQYGPIEDMHGILSHLIASWIAKVKNKHDGVPHQKNKNKAVPFK